MRKLLIGIILLTFNSAIAQNQVNISDIISEILEDAALQDDEDNYTNVQISSEELENIANQKIDLNLATWNDLLQLPFLNDTKVEAILQYRKKYECFYSLGELNGITQLTPKDRLYLMHFVYVQDNNKNNIPSAKKMLTDGRYTISTNFKTVLETQNAYNKDSLGNKKFDGNRFLICTKYKYNYKNYLSYGFTIEKDPGESINFKNNKYGFDFNSAFISLQNINKIDKIIIGDYSITFGQGLILGGGFISGKGTSTNNYQSIGCKLKEYTSSNENWFYRGIATSILINKFNIIAFGSYNQKDATLSGDSASFSSIKTTGYHRTSKELESKDNLTEYTFGLITSTYIKKLRVAIATIGYKFDKMFIPKEQLRYACTRNERENFCYSISYHYIKTLTSIYGETAIDKEGNLATINTIQMRPNAFITTTLMYRNYSKQYLAFNAAALGENSKVNNEEGLLLGIDINANSKLTFKGYTDIFRMPWPTSKVSSGTDINAEAILRANKYFSTQLKYKCKSKLQLSPINDYVKSKYISLQNKYSPSVSLILTNLVQWSNYKYGETCEKGYLIYQNISFKPNAIPINISARYAIFSAPYNARMYAYENDVTNSFSAPAYYYQGCRYYILIDTSITKKIKIQTRFSQWRYFDRNTIGSSDSKIDGNHKTEINVYLQIKI